MIRLAVTWWALTTLSKDVSYMVDLSISDRARHLVCAVSVAPQLRTVITQFISTFTYFYARTMTCVLLLTHETPGICNRICKTVYYNYYLLGWSYWSWGTQWYVDECLVELELASDTSKEKILQQFMYILHITLIVTVCHFCNFVIYSSPNVAKPLKLLSQLLLFRLLAASQLFIYLLYNVSCISLCPAQHPYTWNYQLAMLFLNLATQVLAVVLVSHGLDIDQNFAQASITRYHLLCDSL
jgi:hypothetical protein